MKLIQQEYRFTKPQILAQSNIDRDETGLWQIAFKHLSDMRFNRVLLVAKHFRAITGSGHAMENYLHFTRALKLYFDIDDSRASLERGDGFRQFVL